MTMKELKREIEKMNMYILNNLSFDEIGAIHKRKRELFRAKGYNRDWLLSTSRKKEVEDFLECLINACYDNNVDLEKYYN